MATNSARRYPLQISLRTLLAAMAALSVCLLIGTKVGVVEGCGVAVTMILAVIFVMLKGHREAWVLRPFVAGVVFWMVGFDWCVVRTGCDVCRLHWYEIQVRTLSVPIYRKKAPDHEAFFSEVSSDLGFPCEHQLHRRMKIRAWGFIYGNPNINGICCITGSRRHLGLRTLLAPLRLPAVWR